MIPDGQVHRLNCEPESVTLVQYEEAPVRGLVERCISLDRPAPRESSARSLGGDVQKLQGSGPRAFGMPVWLQGKRLDQFALPPSGFKLVLQHSGDTQCNGPDPRENIEVILRPPAPAHSQDFEVYKFSRPLECGEWTTPLWTLSSHRPGHDLPILLVEVEDTAFTV